jgi:hypothetical protein
MNKDEVKSLFERHTKKNYKKSGTFLYRFPSENETVLTIVAGKLEALKTAVFGESVVLRNISLGSSAETYIIDLVVFAKRYDLIEKSVTVDKVLWKYCEAIGKVEAFCYHGKTIEFVAPWGEKMLCEDGDYIARPLGGSPEDIYRIEKQTFNQTYTEIVT